MGKEDPETNKICGSNGQPLQLQVLQRTYTLITAHQETDAKDANDLNDMKKVVLGHIFAQMIAIARIREHRKEAKDTLIA